MVSSEWVACFVEWVAGVVCESGLSGGRNSSDDRGCPFCWFLCDYC